MLQENLSPVLADAPDFTSGLEMICASGTLPLQMETKGYMLEGDKFSRAVCGEPLKVMFGLMVATLVRLVAKPVVWD